VAAALPARPSCIHNDSPRPLIPDQPTGLVRARRARLRPRPCLRQSLCLRWPRPNRWPRPSRQRDPVSFVGANAA